MTHAEKLRVLIFEEVARAGESVAGLPGTPQYPLQPGLVSRTAQLDSGWGETRAYRMTHAALRTPCITASARPLDTGCVPETHRISISYSAFEVALNEADRACPDTGKAGRVQAVASVGNGSAHCLKRTVGATWLAPLRDAAVQCKRQNQRQARGREPGHGHEGVTA